MKVWKIQRWDIQVWKIKDLNGESSDVENQIIQNVFFTHPVVTQLPNLLKVWKFLVWKIPSVEN